MLSPRFKAFSLGKWVDWHVNYKSSNSNENILFIITANRDNLNEFLVKEVKKNDAKKRGVVVRISELSKQFKILNSEVALDKLLPIFALYLKNYPQIRITVSGGSNITYESGLTNNNFSSGPSGTWSVNSWQEVQ